MSKNKPRPYMETMRGRFMYQYIFIQYLVRHFEDFLLHGEQPCGLLMQNFVLVLQLR